MENRVIVVSGGNRGLGLGIVGNIASLCYTIIIGYLRLFLRFNWPGFKKIISK